MKKMMKTLVLTGVTALICLPVITGAQAKIRCNGIYQTNSIGTFASPYCEDSYLAKIARRYGIRVTNRTIRQNPNKKEEVCRFIGHDSRVREICQGYRSSPFGGGRR